MHILIVEDDDLLGNAILDRIVRAGNTAMRANGLENARAMLRSETFDVLLLDVMLPDGDGRSLARDLRKARNGIPILLLTARDEIDDRVAGLDAGADDYLVKPFAVSELLARLRALHRRPDTYVADHIDCEDLTLDAGMVTLHCGDQNVRLTKAEFVIMNQMMRAPGKVFSKSAIGDLIYSEKDGWNDNALETVIHRLRKKISGIRSVSEVRSIRGLGYLLCRIKH